MESFDPEDIIGLERAALDRWGTGDPQGFLQIMSLDVSYFDPYQERRVDGRDALKTIFDPFAGTFSIDRYEMLQPRVQHDGNVAVLTFNLVNYASRPDGSESVINRWNSTEIYQRIGDSWRLVHSHWSYIQPQLVSAASATEAVATP